MDDVMWSVCMKMLLQWFDDHEGTTYLYHASDREEFLAGLPEFTHPLMKLALDEYHEASTNEPSLPPEKTE